MTALQVTVDLDVIVRDELLSFLKNDSETRGSTILCTHIRCVSSLHPTLKNLIFFK